MPSKTANPTRELTPDSSSWDPTCVDGPEVEGEAWLIGKGGRRRASCYGLTGALLPHWHKLYT